MDNFIYILIWLFYSNAKFTDTQKELHKFTFQYGYFIVLVAEYIQPFSS